MLRAVFKIESRIGLLCSQIPEHMGQRTTSTEYPATKKERLKELGLPKEKARVAELIAKDILRTKGPVGEEH